MGLTDFEWECTASIKQTFIMGTAQHCKHVRKDKDEEQQVAWIEAVRGHLSMVCFDTCCHLNWNECH